MSGLATLDPAFLVAMGTIFGAMIGSFATVVAHRLPVGESFVVGRSHCPSCEAQVAAYDNVPILSWLALRGRCRSCRTPISARYPLTELAVAGAFAGTVIAIGVGEPAELARGVALVSVLAVITLTDLEHRIIPNKVVLFGAVLAVAIVAGFGLGEWPARLIASAAGGGAFLLFAIAYPAGMGMGDVKLVAMMGLYLGASLGPAVLVALIGGSAVGVAMLLRDGSAARKRALPFGPFLALGGLVALWIGPTVIAWYAGLIG